MTAVFRTYEEMSLNAFFNGCSIYSNIDSNRKLHKDLRAKPRTNGFSLSLNERVFNFN